MIQVVREPAKEKHSLVQTSFLSRRDVHREGFPGAGLVSHAAAGALDRVRHEDLKMVAGVRLVVPIGDLHTHEFAIEYTPTGRHDGRTLKVSVSSVGGFLCVASQNEAAPALAGTSRYSVCVGLTPSACAQV
jgi:hypothetical protein